MPTVKPAAKARTPTLAPGNSPGARPAAQSAVGALTGGFTLVELLVVLLLIGLAAGLVSLSLPDPAASRLDREATRLAALLEAGRAEARSSGMAVRFELGAPDTPAQAFRFVGLPPRIELPQRWLYDGVQARIVGASALLLGPEPLIGAQAIELRLDQRRVLLSTDGLAPFRQLDAAQEAS